MATKIGIVSAAHAWITMLEGNQEYRQSAGPFRGGRIRFISSLSTHYHLETEVANRVAACMGQYYDV
ncbi:hypothetical protein PAXINDRAFT_172883 [Paxillus involutus ATCC 200175]|uniref:Unplaced genomic scaffold PAXINscaffold_281, whole genome shotgun sequence n=1 Tax=Paxillus involutus ATCC 200175 TaxID=664439 RepID=A0A0C9SNY4_PAXIN|nr:hypothetical protein PAXINDRAFT_172883 [Paxillus involutus ATCC 200175]